MGKLTSVSVAIARAALKAATHTLPTQIVPLHSARGRFLASDIVADQAIPERARAAMDGFAVMSADLAAASTTSPVSLAVVGEVFAGTLFVGSLKPHEIVRIPTGGCLPSGTDSVVAIEATVPEGADRIRFTAPCESGKNVVPVGQDVQPGQKLLHKGTCLLPAHLGVLAATGNAQVIVGARPRVTVLSSGAEVCAPGVRPSLAQVRDVNQAMLGAMAEALGAHVTYGGIIPDDVDALSKAVKGAVATSDVVILSAGTSVGPRDYLGTVVAGLPNTRVLFHGVHMRPGKPTLVAHVHGGHDAFVCGLPGFPVSAAVAFAVFVAPLLKQLQGALRVLPWRPPIEAVLATPYQSLLGREDYVRVRCVPHGASPQVAHIVSAGPALVTGLLETDGFVMVPAETESLQGGAVVNVLTLDL